MGSSKAEKIIASLDIGTNSTVCLVAKFDESASMEILGIAKKSSAGLKKGVIVDIDSTVDVIKSVLAESESMYGGKINSVVTNVTGSHITSLNSHGIVAIDDGEVIEQDVVRVIDAAKAVPMSSDQKIVHVLPQQYLIDSQDGIRFPVGMSGVRLEANVHIITGAESVVQNIVKSIKRCDIGVSDIIMNSVASAESTLTLDERELGAAVIDIGGGTTDVTLYKNGAIVSTLVLPIAGNQVTNDLAIALRTPTQAAEDLKIKYGYVLESLVPDNLNMVVDGIGDRSSREIEVSVLARVLEARVTELFVLIKEALEKDKVLEKMGAGIVLTGGSAKLLGILELAERVFGLPVRVGLPKVSLSSRSSFNTTYATAIGLLSYSQNKHKNMIKYQGYPRFGRVARVIGNWIKSYM